MFDPMFRDPDTIAENVGRKIKHKNPDHALKLYRRGQKYLRKYHEFEILRYVYIYGPPSSILSKIYKIAAH